MTSPIPVVCGNGYGAAVAELPLRTRQSRDPAGAVVVVSGGGNWCAGVRRAAAAGAAAVVVTHPQVVPSAEIRGLSAELGGLPVILERVLFRSDAASDAAVGRAMPGSGDVRLVAVDGAALAGEVGVVLRDAIAWARVLTRGEVDRHAASGGLALVKSSRSESVLAALSVAEMDVGVPWIRGHALGETRTEVEAATERTVVLTTGDHGSMIAPIRLETPQRLALRRALDALERGMAPADLAELAADAAVAEQLTEDRPLHNHR